MSAGGEWLASVIKCTGLARQFDASKVASLTDFRQSLGIASDHKEAAIFRFNMQCSQCFRVGLRAPLKRFNVNFTVGYSGD